MFLVSVNRVKKLSSSLIRILVSPLVRKNCKCLNLMLNNRKPICFMEILFIINRSFEARSGRPLQLEI